ncbi:MAG: hypothetical protein GEU95_00830 [Rhizobiales bacterium]|nr:hypothetical protein [Hyphomicrobiales bacterium]
MTDDMRAEALHMYTQFRAEINALLDATIADAVKDMHTRDATNDEIDAMLRTYAPSLVQARARALQKLNVIFANHVDIDAMTTHTTAH